MDAELRPYLDAILAAPEDDEPRLTLARFFTDRGDARGDHIRLAVKLEKRDEHHVYTGGAREDTETIPITRADGRIVESVIWHRIWP